jgi:hypothetical protein
MTAADTDTPSLHGPYDDDATASRQAERAADAFRYLNYATRDGLTEPNTAAIITGHLADAAYRLPQLLKQLTEWLTREITAGRIASDHGRPALLLAADTRDQLTDAAQQAAHLARALDHARQLTSTLHATQAEERR